MTNREALEVIERCGVDSRGYPKLKEALSMAIEALKDAGYMKWLEDNLLEYEPVELTCDIFSGSEECEKGCEFTCPQRECLYRAYQEEDGEADDNTGSD